jgi:hypothetical protein
MLTPPRHLIIPSHLSEVRVALRPGKSCNTGCQSRVGDLVYLHCDHNKTKARDRSVVSCDGKWRHISKFHGSQLRHTGYRVKDSNCFLVPSEYTNRYNVAHSMRRRVMNHIMNHQVNLTFRFHHLYHPYPPFSRICHPKSACTSRRFKYFHQSSACRGYTV